jgi:hypothetical protein
MSDYDEVGIDDLEAFYGIDLSDEDDIGHQSDHEDDNPDSLPADSPLSLDALNFDQNQYISTMLQLPMNQVLARVTELGEEKQHLDFEMQVLVYENYNKFITATDVIRSMNASFTSIEREMGIVKQHLAAVTGKSKQMAKALQGAQESVSKLHSLSQLLQSLRYLFKLPMLMSYYYKSKHYGLALRSFDAVAPFLNRYRHLPSFSDILNKTFESIQIIKDDLKREILNTNLFKIKERLVTGAPIVTEYIDVVNNIMYNQYLINNDALIGGINQNSIHNQQKNEQSTQNQQNSIKSSNFPQQPSTPPSTILFFTQFNKDDIVNGLDTLLLHILAGNDGYDHFNNFAQNVLSLLLTYLLPSFCSLQHPQQPNYSFSLPALLLDMGHNMVDVGGGLSKGTNTGATLNQQAASRGTNTGLRGGKSSAQTVVNNSTGGNEIEAPFLLIDDTWIPLNRLQFNIDSKIAPDLLNDIDIKTYEVTPLARSVISPVIRDDEKNKDKNKENKDKNKENKDKNNDNKNNNGENKNDESSNVDHGLEDELKNDRTVDELLHSALTTKLFDKHPIYTELFSSHHIHIFLSLFFFIHYSKQRLILPLLHTMSLRILELSHEKTSALPNTLSSLGQLPGGGSINVEGPTGLPTSHNGLIAPHQHLYKNIFKILEILNAVSTQILTSYVARIEFFTTQLFSTKPLLEQRQRVGLATLVLQQQQLNNTQTGVSTAQSLVNFEQNFVSQNLTQNTAQNDPKNSSKTPTTKPLPITNSNLQTFPRSTLTQVQLSPCPMQLSIIALHSQLHLFEYMTNVNNYVVSPITTYQTVTTTPTILPMQSHGNQLQTVVENTSNLSDNQSNSQDSINSNNDDNNDQNKHYGNKSGDINLNFSQNSINSLHISTLFPSQTTSTNLFPTIPELITHGTKGVPLSSSGNPPLSSPTASSAQMNKNFAQSNLNIFSSLGQLLPLLPYSAISLIKSEGQTLAPCNVIELYGLVNQFSLGSLTEITNATISATSLLSSSMNDITDTLDGLLVQLDEFMPHSLGDISAGALSNHMTAKRIDLHSARSVGSSDFDKKSNKNGIKSTNETPVQLQSQLTSLAPILLGFQKAINNISINSTLFLYELATRSFFNFLTISTNILSSISLPSPYFNNPLISTQSSSALPLDYDVKTNFKQSNELFSILLLSKPHANNNVAKNGPKSANKKTLDSNLSSPSSSFDLEGGLLVQDNLQLYNLDNYDESDLSEGRIKTSMILLESTGQKTPIKTQNLNDFSNDISDIGDKNINKASQQAQTPPTNTEAYFLVKSWVFALFNVREEQFSLSSHVVRSPKKMTKISKKGTNPTKMTENDEDDDDNNDIGQSDEDFMSAVETIKTYCTPHNVSTSLSTLFMTFFASISPFIDLHTAQYKSSYIQQQQQSLLTAHQVPTQLYGNLSSLKPLLPHVSSFLAQNNFGQNANFLNQKNAQFGSQFGGNLSKNSMISSKYSSLGPLVAQNLHDRKIIDGLTSGNGLSVGTSRLATITSFSGSLQDPKFGQNTKNIPNLGQTSQQNSKTRPTSRSGGDFNPQLSQQQLTHSFGALSYIAPSYFGLSTLPMTFQQSQLGYLGSSAGSSANNSISGSVGSVSGSSAGQNSESWATQSIRYANSTTGSLFTSSVLNSNVNKEHIINNADFLHNEHQLQLKSIFFIFLFKTIFNFFQNSYDPILCAPEKHTHIHFKDYRNSLEVSQIELLRNVLSQTYGFDQFSLPIQKDLIDAHFSLQFHSSPLSLVSSVYTTPSASPPPQPPPSTPASSTNTPTNRDGSTQPTSANTVTSVQTNTFLTSRSGFISACRPLVEVLPTSQLAVAYKLYTTRSIYAINDAIIQPHLILVLTQALNLFYTSFCNVLSDDLSTATLFNDALLLNSDVISLHVSPPTTTNISSSQSGDKLNTSSSSTNSTINTAIFPQKSAYKNQLTNILSNLSPSITLRGLQLGKHYVGGLNSNLVSVVQSLSPTLDFVPNNYLIQFSTNLSNSNPGAALRSIAGNIATPRGGNQLLMISGLELRMTLIGMMKSFGALSQHFYNNINVSITKMVNKLILSNYSIGWESLHKQTLLFNQHVYTGLPLPENLNNEQNNDQNDKMTPKMDKIEKTDQKQPLTQILPIHPTPPLLLHNSQYVPWKTTPQSISNTVQLVIAYLDHLHWFIHVVILSLDAPKVRQNTLSPVVLKYNSFQSFPTCSCHQNDSVILGNGNQIKAYDDEGNYIQGGKLLDEKNDRFFTKNYLLSSNTVSTCRLQVINNIDCCNIFTNAIINTLTTLQRFTFNKRLDKYDIQQFQFDFFALQNSLLTLADDQDRNIQLIKNHSSLLLPLIFSRFDPNLHTAVVSTQNSIKAQVKAILDPNFDINSVVPGPERNIIAQMMKYFVQFPSNIFDPCVDDLCLFDLPTTQSKDDIDNGIGGNQMSFKQQFNMKVLLSESVLIQLLSQAFYPSYNLHTLPYLSDE